MHLAVRIHETGGADVLKLEEVGVAPPGMSEVTLRQKAVGLNFIDIYHRTGLYKLPSYPAVLGLEASGVVEKVGEWVTHLKPGDRVAYCGGPTGAYAQRRTLPAKHVVKIPDAISDDVAAAVMLKGLTAHYLLRSTFRVQKGDVLLLHAAAGGVGLIAGQWAKHLGATVIGTVGSEEKAKLARENGCDHAIIYTRENVVQKVKEFTDGKGVDVAYDSVGKTTFMDSLDCLKPMGMMVSFGQSSGPVAPLDISALSQKGSLYLTRPTLMHHIEDTGAYAKAAAELFGLIEKGVIRARIGRTYPLKEVRQAHRDLEGRKTTGAAVLTLA